MLCRPHTHPTRVLHPARAYQTATIRSFHSTRSNQLVAEAIETSRTVFELVHDSSGLGWGGAIFLTGFVCRAPWFVTTYWLTSANKQRHKTQTPLEIAWSKYHNKTAIARFPPPETSESHTERLERFRKQQDWSVKQTRRIDSLTQGGSSRRKHWTFSEVALQSTFLPTWLVNLDVVRRMAGAQTSILAKMHLPNTIDLIPVEPAFATETFYNSITLTAGDWNSIYGLIAMYCSLQFFRLYSNQELAAMWWISTEQNPRDRPPKLDYRLFYVSGCFFVCSLDASECSAAVMLYLLGSVSGQLFSSMLADELVKIEDPLDTTAPKNAQLKPEYRDKKALDRPREPSTSLTDSQTESMPRAVVPTPKTKTTYALPKQPSKSFTGKPIAHKRE